MSTTVAINTAISFFIHTLEDLECKYFPFLRPLIDLIEHYHKKFRMNGSIEYIQKIIDQLNSYQTYKDMTSYLFNMVIDMMKDIMCYLRSNYNEFLQVLTVHLLEIYDYVITNYIKSYLKKAELQKIIEYLKGVATRETLMEMMYDDSIVYMIISILFPVESHIGGIISFISDCSGEPPGQDESSLKPPGQDEETIEPQYQSYNPVSIDTNGNTKDIDVQSSDDDFIPISMSYEQQTNYHEDLPPGPKNSPIIEKNNIEKRDDRLKRILAKYGRHRNYEHDKTPPKEENQSYL